MNRISLLIVTVVSLVIAALLSTGFGLFFVTPANEEGKDRVFVIDEGSSLRDVAAELERGGIIMSGALFSWWAKLKGASRGIKAGEYALNPNMAPKKILQVITLGSVMTHSITIPEGFTVLEIADSLEKKDLVKKDGVLRLWKDPEILMRYGIESPSLEGYLYPETYQFARGLSPLSIMDVMINRFLDVMKPFKGRIKETGLRMEEVVTLASIVEKETGRAEERPRIASVFLNRLKKGMRLESDPTVIYGIKKFDGNLTRAHLKKYTPYNTYRIKGLPPGPIANPGEDSIRAVLYPEKTDYLYFVSKNDGSHHFSNNLKEHNRAVFIYQKKRKKRKGKSS